MKAFTFATIAAISVAHPHHGHEGRKHEHEHGYGEEHEHRHGDGHGHGKHPMRDWFKDNKHPILDGIKEITHDIFDVVHDKAEVYKSLFEDLKDRAKEEITMYDQPSLAGNFVSSSIKKNNMGCLVEETIYDNDYVEKVVTAPAYDYVHDYVQ